LRIKIIYFGAITLTVTDEAIGAQSAAFSGSAMKVKSTLVVLNVEKPSLQN